MPSDSTRSLESSSEASNVPSTSSGALESPFGELRRFLRGVASTAAPD